MNNETKKKFESIDMMRGIAILMVILVHTAQQVSPDSLLRNFALYGQMGVQLFFIASAFTLCYSMDSRPNEPLSHFYLRRFFRIAPGYYVGILIYFLINVICNLMNVTSAWEGGYGAVNILANVFFLNGLYSPANNNVVPGGWSIGTEMLFYLIFPFLFSLYKHLQTKFKHTYLVLPLVALVISLFVQMFIYAQSRNPQSFENNSFIYFSILNQLPVFCVGISVYFAYKMDLLKRISTIWCFLGFLLFTGLSGALIFKGVTMFTFAFSITPFISALSFVFIFTLLQYRMKFKNKLLVNVGVLSYSCYLLHIVFAYFVAGYLADILSFILPDALLILLYALTVTLTFLTAGVMHQYVEKKGIALGKSVIRATPRLPTNVKSPLPR